MNKNDKRKDDEVEECLEGYLWLMRSFAEEVSKELQTAVDDRKTSNSKPREKTPADTH